MKCFFCLFVSRRLWTRWKRGADVRACPPRAAWKPAGGRWPDSGKSAISYWKSMTTPSWWNTTIATGAHPLRSWGASGGNSSKIWSSWKALPTTAGRIEFWVSLARAGAFVQRTVWTLTAVNHCAVVAATWRGMWRLSGSVDATITGAATRFVKSARSAGSDTCVTRAWILPVSSLNPFTPKSDQVQISPAVSPEILHYTVWRTCGFFVAH